MIPSPSAHWIAFAGRTCIATGRPEEVAASTRAFMASRPDEPVLVLDACSSHPVEIDLRGSLATIPSRLPATPAPEPAPVAAAVDVRPRGPGRPRLGVVAREVTLLPRHWDWLGTQPGGASVALRKLVEKAQRANAESDRRRVATESAYRFMHALAGDEPGFEEASRALFAGRLDRLDRQVAGWPHDVRKHLLELAGRAMDADPAADGTRPATG